ncbi:MAG: O-antigen ligase family protein [Verrucomicrobia bacterium]|nr:O-antigen ligase family protein [Verrucomicrobiota bacterium]
MKLKQQTGTAAGRARRPPPPAGSRGHAVAPPPSAPAAATPGAEWPVSIESSLFAAAAGVWLGLALLKFGNPAILEHRLERPSDVVELVLGPWPISWGYWLLGGLVLASLRFWRWQLPRAGWLAALPLAWFTWQVCSGIQSVEPSLTRPVLAHFAGCVAAFYVGLLALSSGVRLRLFWAGLFGAFVLVLVVGWQQRFGGLEETRRFFYALPNWKEFPPEFLEKLASDRIYSTLFYPNTLAGVILLLLPALLAAAWQTLNTAWAKWASAAVLGGMGLACLYWSGSKAGWLIALALAVPPLMRLNLPRRTKLATATALALAGVGGFLTVYSGYFSRGATSLSARMDYWEAGWKLMWEKPLLGSGPGTFAAGYERLKAPDAEMARLAHNDYLQQGCDSGVLGMVLYGGFMAGMLIRLHAGSKRCPLRYATWLGLVGLALQSMVEFGLYNPATAWTQFMLLGWLCGAERTAAPHVDMPV